MSLGQPDGVIWWAGETLVGDEGSELETRLCEFQKEWLKSEDW